MYVNHEGDANIAPDKTISTTFITKTLVQKKLLSSDVAARQNKNHTMLRTPMNLCDRG